jgi:phosphoesterase RecJ-like protein
MYKKIIHNKIFAAVAERKKFALVMHRKPDADTIGSASAFSIYLKKQGKEFKFFCQDEVPENFYSLLNSAGIFNIEEIYRPVGEIIKYAPDCAITFDCGDTKQAGFFGTGIREQLQFLINIDHHISNNGYGDINLVSPEASSNCEIVYEMFSKNKIVVTKEMATCLFMGIFSDTGNFTNPATSDIALASASELMLSGAKFHNILKEFTKDKNVGALRVWGAAFKRLKYDESAGVVTTFLKLEDLLANKVSEESIEGISSFLNKSIKARAIIVYREAENGFVKASIRSGSDFDASEFAKSFGGGGHKKAAGFTIKGVVTEKDCGWEAIQN